MFSQNNKDHLLEQLEQQGLPNVGSNTCFLNTIINVLYGSSSFRNFIFQSKCRTKLSKSLQHIFVSIKQCRSLKLKQIYIEQFTKILQQQVSEYRINSEQDAIFILQKFNELMTDIFTQDMFHLFYRKVCLKQMQKFCYSFTNKIYYSYKQLFLDNICQKCQYCNHQNQQHYLTQILTKVSRNILLKTNNLGRHKKNRSKIYTQNKQLYLICCIQNYIDVEGISKLKYRKQIIKYKLKSRGFHYGNNQTGHYIAIRKKIKQIMNQQTSNNYIQVQSDNFYKYDDQRVNIIDQSNYSFYSNNFKTKFSLYEIQKIYKIEDLKLQLKKYKHMIIDKEISQFLYDQLEDKIAKMQEMVQNFQNLVKYLDEIQKKELLVAQEHRVCNKIVDMKSHVDQIFTLSQSEGKQLANKGSFYKLRYWLKNCCNKFSSQRDTKQKLKQSKQQINLQQIDNSINLKISYVNNSKIRNDIQHRPQQYQSIWNKPKTRRKIERLERLDSNTNSVQDKLNSVKQKTIKKEDQIIQLTTKLNSQQFKNQPQDVQQSAQYFSSIITFKQYEQIMFRINTYLVKGLEQLKRNNVSFYQTKLSSILKNQKSYCQQLKQDINKQKYLSNTNPDDFQEKVYFFQLRQYSSISNLRECVRWIRTQRQLILALIQQIKVIQNKKYENRIFPNLKKYDYLNPASYQKDYLFNLVVSANFSKYWQQIKKGFTNLQTKQNNKCELEEINISIINDLIKGIYNQIARQIIKAKYQNKQINIYK